MNCLKALIFDALLLTNCFLDMSIAIADHCGVAWLPSFFFFFRELEPNCLVNIALVIFPYILRYGITLKTLEYRAASPWNTTELVQEDLSLIQMSDLAVNSIRQFLFYLDHVI